MRVDAWGGILCAFNAVHIKSISLLTDPISRDFEALGLIACEPCDELGGGLSLLCGGDEVAISVGPLAVDGSAPSGALFDACSIVWVDDFEADGVLIVRPCVG